MPVAEPEPVVVAVPEPAPPAAARPAPTPARPPARRPAVNEPERETPPAAAQTPPQNQPALRAAPTGADAAADRAVRETLQRAARDLGRVDYGRLSTDGRSQYEQSKRFTTQAEDALRDRNFPFAATLADKAATLAAELLGSR